MHLKPANLDEPGTPTEEDESQDVDGEELEEKLVDEAEVLTASEAAAVASAEIQAGETTPSPKTAKSTE